MSTYKPKGYWTKDRCLEEIKRLNNEGFDLSPSNTRRYQGSLYTKSVQLLGGWGEAIELAGLDYSSIQKKKQNGYWTEKKTLDEIKYLYNQGVDLSPVSISKINNGLYQGAIKVYGSWYKALTICNINYVQIKRKKENNYWTKKTVNEEISRLVKDGKPLNTSYIETVNYGLYKGALRLYGSWETTLTTLGIDYNQVRLNDEYQKSFGQRFEKVVHRLLSELGYKYIRNKEIAKGLRPDIVFPDRTIFDIKLSNYTDFQGSSTVEKYGLYSSGIGIIFLRGEFKEKEYQINKVTFRHISFYTEQLTNDRRIYYEDVLNKLLIKANECKEASE